MFDTNTAIDGWTSRRRQNVIHQMRLSSSAYGRPYEKSSNCRSAAVVLLNRLVWHHLWPFQYKHRYQWMAVEAASTFSPTKHGYHLQPTATRTPNLPIAALSPPCHLTGGICIISGLSDIRTAINGWSSRRLKKIIHQTWSSFSAYGCLYGTYSNCRSTATVSLDRLVRHHLRAFQYKHHNWWIAIEAARRFIHQTCSLSLAYESRYVKYYDCRSAATVSLDQWVWHHIQPF